MKKVDFHMHTTHSDGTYSPAELLQYCAKKNLACVSVTDHDTMSSYDEAAAEAKKLGVELVPGVELSAIFDPGTLHILGYFLDRNHPELKAAFEDIQEARRNRNPRIIACLNRAGVDITMEEVLEEAFSGAAAEVSEEDKQVGRPHFAKVMVKKGVVANTKEAFDKYLGKGGPAYIDKRRVTPEQSIDLINKAGGIASIAHPKQMKLDDEALDREIKRFADAGLGGIEVFNSCQGPVENAVYMRLAKKYNLVVTAGSDFHGGNKPGVDLGGMGQDVRVGYEMVDQLRERIAARKK